MGLSSNIRVLVLMTTYSPIRVLITLLTDPPSSLEEEDPVASSRLEKLELSGPKKAHKQKLG